jgi:hypothetical protein
VCACVRTTCFPLAPFTRTCIVVIQNYILPVFNKLAVTIFLPPYRCAFGFCLFPCQVTILLRGSSKKTRLHFLGHTGRSAQQAVEVWRGTNWASKLAISRLPGDVNVGTGGNDAVLVVCVLFLWDLNTAMRCRYIHKLY